MKPIQAIALAAPVASAGSSRRPRTRAPIEGLCRLELDRGRTAANSRDARGDPPERPELGRRLRPRRRTVALADRHRSGARRSCSSRRSPSCVLDAPLPQEFGYPDTDWTFPCYGGNWRGERACYPRTRRSAADSTARLRLEAAPLRPRHGPDARKKRRIRRLIRGLRGCAVVLAEDETDLLLLPTASGRLVAEGANRRRSNISGRTPGG